MTQFLCITIILMSVVFNCRASYSDIILKEKGYEGILIAVNPEIEENPGLIESLKEIFTEASKTLWQATRNGVYFKEITILVPDAWADGYYSNSTNMKYSRADVLVAKPNPSYNDEPYTVQYGSCGDPGQYIHLTPSYLQDDMHIKYYGVKSKTVVHEWAHLRWGVFDETSESEPFYFKNGVVEAARCPASLRGTNILPAGEWSNTTDVCPLDMATGYPVEGCIFVVNELQDKRLAASIMSHQFVNQVTTFCHDDLSDPVNRHNSDAPNEQNRLCDRRSAWDIISSSSDFVGINTTRNNGKIIDPTPNFEVVRMRSTQQRFVLVLDASGSMGDESSRFGSMLTAASLFILNYAPIGSQVGIVQYNRTVTILTQLRPLTDEVARQNTLLYLPQSSGGFTCISCGILAGIEVLENGNVSAYSGEIILLTDGHGSVSNEAMNAVVSKEVVLSTIFFGVDRVNDKLQLLTERTGGTWSFDSDLQSLIQSFKRFAENDNGDEYSKDMQIHTNTIEDPSGTVQGIVSVDFTIGNNTIFTFAWSEFTSPDVQLISPSGAVYCSQSHNGEDRCNDSVAIVDEKFKTIMFEIPGVAETGKWVYGVTSKMLHTISVIVSSRASNRSVAPIKVETWLSTTDVGNMPLVIYARVTQGFVPILGSSVFASVRSPRGTTTQLELFDGGADPDVRKNDGTYSRYFLDYSVKGRYTVQITASGNGKHDDEFQVATLGSSAQINFGTVLHNGTVALNQNATNIPKVSITASSIDAFQRTDSSAVFSTASSTLGSRSSFPPGKVSDLAANQVSINDISEGIHLTFTSPGADYDNGRASMYELRYSYGSTKNLVLAFATQSLLEGAAIIQGNPERPGSAGSEEKFVVLPDDLPWEAVVTVAFAVRAFKEKRRNAVGGEVSNVAVASVFVVPPGTSLPNTTTTDPITTNSAITESQRKTDNALIFMIVGIVCFTVVACGILYIVATSLKKRSNTQKASSIKTHC